MCKVVEVEGSRGLEVRVRVGGVCEYSGHRLNM